MKLKSTIKGLLFILCFSAVIACKESTSSNTSIITETAISTSDSQNPTYTSKMTKSDKKKYYDASDNVVYEIKYKDDGLKLRSASSTLLWKVKFYDDKIKISDNEENENPYEIKMTETYKAKLVKNDETIARTTYDLSAKKQDVTGGSSSDSQSIETSYTPSLLVSMISEIPKDQQEILIKELKEKGY